MKVRTVTPISFFSIDIDECEVTGLTPLGVNITKAGCESGCINLNGTFKCTCQPGWILLADGKTCAGKYN